jgi:hypothetical protein
VRHGLLTVDGLARPHRIDHHLFVPVVGNGGQNAVDVLVVEEFVISPRDRQIRFVGDFARESVPAVVEVGGGDTLDSGQLDGIGQNAGAFHADADDAEAQAIAGSDARIRSGFQALVAQENRIGGRERSGADGGAVQKFTARKLSFHRLLLVLGTQEFNTEDAEKSTEITEKKERPRGKEARKQ